MARDLKIARLFYEIEAESKGLQGELDRAEKSFGRLATFITANPMAATGALGAAFVALGLKATDMAGEVDGAMRVIAATVPDAVNRFDDLKEVAKELSIQFGISQVEVVGTMQAIGKAGVESTDALIAATRAATVAAKAWGVDTGTVIAALDPILDGFNLAATDSEAVLAKLFVTAQGKASIEELGAAFAKLGGPGGVVQKTGLDFNTLSAAVATLIAQGTPVKQLATILGNLDAAGIRDLASQSTVATDGLKELRAQADLVSGSLENQGARLRENFNAVLIELGDKILPYAIKGLDAFIGLLDHLNGTVAKIEFGAANATVQTFTNTLTSLHDEAAKTEALDKLKGGLAQLAGIGGILPPTFQNIRAGLAEIGGQKSAADLAVIRDGLLAAGRSGLVAGADLDQLNAALRLVNTEAAKFRSAPLVHPDTARGLDEVIAGAGKLTEAQKATIRELLRTGVTVDEIKSKFSAALGDAVTRYAGLVKATGQAADKQAELRTALDKALGPTVVLMIDQTTQAVEELLAKAQGKLSTAELQRYRAELEKHKAVVSTLTAAERELQTIQEGSTGVDQVAELYDLWRQVSEVVLETVEGTKDNTDALALQKDLVERINDAEQARVPALQEITEDTGATYDNLVLIDGVNAEWNAKLGQLVPKTTKVKAETADIAGQVGEVARGVLGLATAFSDVSDHTAVVLGNVINIGVAIGQALGKGKLDLTSIVGVLGSLAGLLGSLFGGDSPAERRAREVFAANEEAIRKNTDALRENLPGARFGKVQDAFAGLPAFGPSDAQKIDFGTKLSQTLDRLYAMGYTFNDLKDIASSLGIELDGSLSSWDQFARRLNQVDLTSFGKGLDDLNARIRTGVRLGTITAGAGEFTAFTAGLQELSGGAPTAITAALAKGDVNTAEGRTAIRAALQDLFTNFSSLNAQALGGLNPDQFMAVLERLVDLLDTIDQAAAPTTSTPTPSTGSGPTVGPTPGSQAPAPSTPSVPSVPTTEPPAPVSAPPVGSEFLAALGTSNQRLTEIRDAIAQLASKVGTTVTVNTTITGVADPVPVREAVKSAVDEALRTIDLQLGLEYQMRQFVRAGG